MIRGTLRAADIAASDNVGDNAEAEEDMEGRYEVGGKGADILVSLLLSVSSYVIKQGIDSPFYIGKYIVSREEAIIRVTEVMTAHVPVRSTFVGTLRFLSPAAADGCLAPPQCPGRRRIKHL